MQYSTNGNFTVCGTPYAVCIAETPHEAELLNKFMENLANGENSTSFEGYAVEHCGYYSTNLYDESLSTLEEAREIVQDMVEDDDESCMIYGLTPIEKGTLSHCVNFEKC